MSWFISFRPIPSMFIVLFLDCKHIYHTTKIKTKKSMCVVCVYVWSFFPGWNFVDIRNDWFIWLTVTFVVPRKDSQQTYSRTLPPPFTRPSLSLDRGNSHIVLYRFFFVINRILLQKGTIFYPISIVVRLLSRPTILKANLVDEDDTPGTCLASSSCTHTSQF